MRELVERRFGKRLGLSTVRLYLQRWGMTPQKPLVRAKERSPAAIQAWLERDYPAIAKRAKTVRGMIYWGDETGISNQDQIGRSYAPRGKTPVVARLAKRISRSMISAVSNRGLMRFMLYDGALDADRFIDFLRRLIKDAGRKVLLIVDNLKVHKAGKVQAWVESHAHEIELHYLPAYAPDHNPTEYLNNDLKQKLRRQPQPGSKDELASSGFPGSPASECGQSAVPPLSASLRGLEPAPSIASTRVMRLAPPFRQLRLISVVMDTPRPSGCHRWLLRDAHAGIGGDRGRSSAISRRISANSGRGTATSAIWKVT